MNKFIRVTDEKSNIFYVAIHHIAVVTPEITDALLKIRLINGEEFFAKMSLEELDARLS